MNFSKNKYAVNDQLFNQLAQLNLPLTEYAITGSGPMGIRGLRKMHDIDLLVTMSLWEQLAKKYPETVENGLHKLKLSKTIEAVHPASFTHQDASVPSVLEQITSSEEIHGLSFVRLPITLFFKQRSKREKDRRDAILITQWLEDNPQ